MFLLVPRRLLVSLRLAAIVCGSLPVVAQPLRPSLRSAGSFAIISTSGIANSGPSRITGDLGVPPGTDAGFPPATVSLGRIVHDDAVVREAQKDAASAYTDLANRPCAVPPVSPLTNPVASPIGAVTLPPGVYCFQTDGELTGTLTLDANDDPNAVWIFRGGGALTADADSSIVLSRGAHAGNVFWQTGGSATLGARSTFVGTILASGNITLNHGASLYGRALTRSGAVTLDTNLVSFCCDPVTLDPLALSTPPSNAPYATIGAHGGSGPYTFALFSDALPTGLKLESNGLLTGTPPASSTFIVITTDSRDCSGIRTYTICPATTLSPDALPGGMVYIPYDQTIRPGCGTCQVTSGNLPPGLFLDGCEIKGTPTKPGPYPFTLSAGDGGSRDYTIVVTCPPITLSPSSLPTAITCAPYSVTFMPSCGTAQPFSETGVLPIGLHLNMTTGVLDGTPAQGTEGSYPIIVTAGNDANGCPVSRQYTLVVTGVTLSPAVLPNGVVSIPYFAIVDATGGTAPYTFSIIGLPPPGLTFTPNAPTPQSATISGTPTASGTFNFTITVTDANGCMSSQPYTVRIDSAVVGAPALSAWGMLVLSILLVLAGIVVAGRSGLL